MRGSVTGRRPLGLTAPVSTAASPLPPSSPGGKNRIGRWLPQPLAPGWCTRPLSTTTTRGVPVVATASTSSCCTPVRSRLAASLPSPTVAGRASRSCPPLPLSPRPHRGPPPPPPRSPTARLRALAALCSNSTLSSSAARRPASGVTRRVVRSRCVFPRPRGSRLPSPMLLRGSALCFAHAHAVDHFQVDG